MATEELRFPWFRAYRRQLMMATVPLGLAAVVFRRAWPLTPQLSMTLTIIGVVAIITGALVRLLAAKEILNRKKIVVVKTGIYSSTRNPLYFGNFIAGLGLAAIAQSLTLLALVLLVYVPVYFLVILHEERRLLGMHGDVYGQYLTETPRFFPRLFGKGRSGSTMSWDSRLLKREIPNMAGLFAAALALKGCHQLQEMLNLPGFFP